MRDLRIVFMGTPEFAVASLDKLIKAKKKNGIFLYFLKKI